MNTIRLSKPVIKNVVVQEVALPPQINLEIEVDCRIEVRIVILKQIKVYSSHDIASFLLKSELFHLLAKVSALMRDKMLLKA